MRTINENHKFLIVCFIDGTGSALDLHGAKPEDQLLKIISEIEKAKYVKTSSTYHKTSSIIKFELMSTSFSKSVFSSLEEMLIK